MDRWTESERNGISMDRWSEEDPILIDRSSIQNNQSIERETSSSLFRLSLSLIPDNKNVSYHPFYCVVSIHF